MERRGPHKSMHCKFCKPPGTVAPENPTPAQLETKTKLHLSHATADLKVYDVYDEPGVVAEESEACMCQLEGYQPCPKCAPDKKRRPKKKEVCDCPLGSKPHANMAQLDKSGQKKKKRKEDDDEFWWEKYDREHDAMVKEMWAAYLAQRKEDKRLIKLKEKQGINTTSLMKPKWYQRLSRQQTTYLEYLAKAIRLDLDEKISDRTAFVVRGIGFYPRPKKKMLEKCLRYCGYNSILFLEQLALLLQEMDPYEERVPLPNIPEDKQDLYAWNDRIVMACICHLEFPKLLREIMERLPQLPKEKLLPPLPKPKFRRPSRREYESPYDEPLWRERMNWVEEQKLERINRARAHMSTKVVKIPYLALVQRPSLIDARPSFLSQMEASPSFPEQKKRPRKKPRRPQRNQPQLFNSKVDFTAIAGIEASEPSTTSKTDGTEICVFLREPKEEEEEEEESGAEHEGEEGEGMKTEANTGEPVADTRAKTTEKLSAKSSSLHPEENELPVEGSHSSEEDDIPFVTPPKTKSGATIEEPCPPPASSPGPPVPNYTEAKRELGLINQELCAFDPNDGRTNDDDEKAGERSILDMNVGGHLQQVLQKLKELNLGENEDEKEEEQEEEGVQLAETKIPQKTVKKRIKKKGEGKVQRKDERKKKKPKKPRKVSLTYDSATDDATKENVTSGYFEEHGEEDQEQGACVCRGNRENEKKEKGKGRNKSGKKVKGKRKGESQKKKKRRNIDPCRREKEEEKLSSTVTDAFEMDKSENFEERTGGGVKTEELPLKGISSLEAKVEPEESKTFRGDVEPLLTSILKDLNEEGFISAGYEEIVEHPDIKQLMKHLKGEIVKAKTKKKLYTSTRLYWKFLEKKRKPNAPVPELNISTKKFDAVTWNDKHWVMNLANKKKDGLYFNIAKIRANEAKDFYLTLFQEYFGSERFLKSYYAYMIATRTECIMRSL